MGTERRSAGELAEAWEKEEELIRLENVKRMAERLGIKPEDLPGRPEFVPVEKLQEEVDSGRLVRVGPNLVDPRASEAALKIAEVASDSIIGANVQYDTTEYSSGLILLAKEVGRKLINHLFPDRYPPYRPHVMFVMDSLIDNVCLPEPERRTDWLRATLLRNSIVLGFHDPNGLGMARVGEGAEVSESTVLGPVQIGKNAKVRDYSVISDVSPSPVPIVGDGAVVDRSVVGYLDPGEELRLPRYADEATVTRITEGGRLFGATAK